jgi:predicted ester cyclase
MRASLPLALSLAVGIACHPKRQTPEPAAPAVPSAPVPAPSAAGGTPNATAEPAPDPEALTERYVACWAAFNRDDFAELASCYAEAATSRWLDSGLADDTGRSAVLATGKKRLKTAFPDANLAPQRVFVSGSNVAAIGLLSGTQRGPLQGADAVLQPTGKQIGQLVFHDARFDANGRILEEALLLDRKTLFYQLGRPKSTGRQRSQLGPVGAPAVVAASGDATEVGNLDVITAAWSAFADESLDGVAATLADDVVLADQTASGDKIGKVDVLASLGGLLGGLTQIHVDCPRRFAAGAYVVSVCEIHATSATARPDQSGLPLAFTLAEVVRLENGLQKEIVRFADMARLTSELEGGAKTGLRKGLRESVPSPR